MQNCWVQSTINREEPSVLLTAQLSVMQEVANPSATLYVDSEARKRGNLDIAGSNRFCWWALTEQSYGWGGTSSN